MARATHSTKERVRRIAGYCARIAVTFAAYFVAGKIGLSTPFTSNNISPVWPASGVALSAILFFNYRIWPGIAAAAFLVVSAANFTKHLYSGLLTNLYAAFAVLSQTCCCFAHSCGLLTNEEERNLMKPRDGVIVFVKLSEESSRFPGVRAFLRSAPRWRG